MASVLVKSPAKLIISGEHSVLHNKTALTCAIDLWLSVKLSIIRTPNIVVSGYKSKTTYPLRDFSMEAKNHNLVLEIVRRFCNQTRVPICGLKISIKSQIPMNSGLGSSAALIVAMVFGLNELLNTKENYEDLIKLAISLEDLCHGKSSGVDIATVARGGVMWFSGRKSEKMPHAIDEIWLIDTGKSRFSTKNVVHYVEDNFNKTALIWKDFTQTTSIVAECITNGKHLSACIGQNEKLLENLGVVSKPVQTFIKTLLTYNIYAKVCGSGTIGSKDDGCGVVAIFQRLSSTQVRILTKVCKRYNFKLRKTQVINAGVEVGYYV